jgi:hypothetical protein
MSNYHDEIMNIRTLSNERIENQLQEKMDFDGLVVAYKIGHRDACHRAAELAIEADQRIAELEATTSEMQLTIDSLRQHVATERRLAESVMDALGGYRNEAELPECAIRRLRSELAAANARIAELEAQKNTN